jgi:Na+/pantothenate symporter
MNRDRRPVIEQVKSGFRIVGKMLVAFAIAVTFMAGSALIRTPRSSNQLALGWALILMSVLIMTTIVRFWAAGFFGSSRTVLGALWAVFSSPMCSTSQGCIWPSFL